MRTITKVLTNDGKEWQNSTQAVNHLNNAIQDKIGYVVDQLCIQGVVPWAKKLQCYELLQYNIESLSAAHKLLIELSDGLQSEEEGN